MNTRDSASTIGWVFVAGLFVGALGACSDGTGPGADLTQEQAAKVAQAISENAYQQNFGSAGSASNLGAGAVSLSLDGQVSADTTVEYSASGQGPCREGGSASWSVDIGAYQSETRDSVSLDGTLSYDACTSTVDSSTVTLTTVEDSPFDYDATLVQSTTDSTLDWSSRLSGGVEWSLDGESGVCDVTVESEITVTGVGSSTDGSVDATTSGQVCNRTIERSFSLQASS